MSNIIHEEIKRGLKLCNAWYHSIHSLMSSRLLSKELKIKIQKKNVTLPIALYGCET
jgi:hypothetical protein